MEVVVRDIDGKELFIYDVWEATTISNRFSRFWECIIKFFLPPIYNGTVSVGDTVYRLLRYVYIENNFGYYRVTEPDNDVSLYETVNMYRAMYWAVQDAAREAVSNGKVGR